METTLEIHYSDFCESPRDWCGNLGKFITQTRNYISPDEDKYLSNIISEAYETANSLGEHIKNITKLLKADGEKVSLVLPVCKYEHSGVYYFIGSQNGFDYSNCGFYIVTQEDLKNAGLSKFTRKNKLEKMVASEIDLYNQYANGEIYEFDLKDLNGNSIESCSGFYNIEDIKDYLPDEYKDKDLTQFLKYQ